MSGEVNDCLDAQAQLARWNKPSSDVPREFIGTTPPDGDSRVTNAGDFHGVEVTEGVDLLYGEDLDDLSKSELQDQAEARGLAKSGSKDELRDRIDEHDNSDEE